MCLATFCFIQWQCALGDSLGQRRPLDQPMMSARSSRQDLDGYIWVEFRISRRIYLAHSACTELGGDAIDPDGRANHFLSPG